MPPKKIGWASSVIISGTPVNASTGNEKLTENSLASGELPRKSQAQPLTLRTIIKLDQNSMVWPYEGIATRVESIGPFFSIFFTTAGTLIAYMAGSVLFDPTSDLEGKIIAVSKRIIFTFALPGCGNLRTEDQLIQPLWRFTLQSKNR